MRILYNAKRRYKKVIQFKGGLKSLENALKQ